MKSSRGSIELINQKHYLLSGLIFGGNLIFHQEISLAPLIQNSLSSYKEFQWPWFPNESRHLKSAGPSMLE
jgi:hypothetical protein